MLVLHLSRLAFRLSGRLLRTTDGSCGTKPVRTESVTHSEEYNHQQVFIAAICICPWLLRYDLEIFGDIHQPDPFIGACLVIPDEMSSRLGLVDPASLSAEQKEAYDIMEGYTTHRYGES